MFDFVGNRKYFFGFSALILIACIIALIYHQGMNLDIQFQGGTILEFQMKNPNVDLNKAINVAQQASGKIANAQTSYSLDTTNERVDLLVLNIASRLSEEEYDKVVAAIEENFEVKEGTKPTPRVVDPVMGKEMAAKSILAIVIAAALMVVYVWVRFKVMGGLLAGLASVVALLHDVMVMIALYAILQLPVNESFIAAILTIVGYSINDTIVIFDRIRENSTLLRKESLATIANKSISQSLSRTINTALTTIVCILTVYIFAAYYNIESIKLFVLPLLVGLISGTYSTIFIASPLWVVMKERQAKKLAASKPAKA
ncbi:MAG TPA: protein translocase subunit SecF [Acetivibrio clariflavus]|nr:protein translocase subunit SecF [Acetivibrio clariflavus]